MIDLKRVSVKAVVIGAALDLGVSTLFGSMVGFAFVIALLGRGLPEAEAYVALAGSTEFLVTCMVGGLLITVICGYITAMISKTAEVPNALCFGIVTTALSISIDLFLTSESPLWYSALSGVLVSPCAAFGGYIRQRRRLSQQNDEVDTIRAELGS